MSKKPKPTQTIEEKRVEAIRVIEEAKLLQDSRWASLSNTVTQACFSVVTMRLDTLEDPVAESGYPLWLGIVLSSAMAFIPVEALVASWLPKLIVFSRKALGRINLDKEAHMIVSTIEAIDKDLGLTGINERNLSTIVADSLLKNDKMTVQVVKFLKAPISKDVETMLNSATEAGVRPLFGAPGEKAPREKNLRANNPPLVAIHKALTDWIIASQLAEGRALLALKQQVQEKKDITIEEIENMIRDFKEDQDESSVSNYDYKGEDFQTLIQQFIEKCIWCTTYNFLPKVETLKIPSGSNPFVGEDFQPLIYSYPKGIVPPDFSEKFWDRLTAHFIEDPKTGETFKDSKKSISNNKYIKEEYIKLLEAARGPEAVSALRLAYTLNQLRQDLTKENLRVVDLLKKALQK